MIWVLLLLGHLVGLVGYTLLLRKSALSSVNKYLLAALMQTVIFVPSLLFVVLGKVSLELTAGSIMPLVASGGFLVGVHLLSILALKNLEASFFTIIYNLRLFLTTIFGYIFLSELPSRLQIVGGFIIFASILMLNLHKNRRFTEKGFLIGLLTTVWFSAHATLEKYNVTNAGFETYMVVAGALATAGLWAIVVYRRINIREMKHLWNKHTVSLLFARTLSAWAYVYALLYGSLAVTNYVSGMGVVLIVLFGVVLLNERDNLKQKLLATGVAVIGLTLIFISKLLQ